MEQTRSAFPVHIDHPARIKEIERQEKSGTWIVDGTIFCRQCKLPAMRTVSPKPDKEDNKNEKKPPQYIVMCPTVECPNISYSPEECQEKFWSRGLDFHFV